MKKLIIAAAVAVVSVGAFALDGYDFTATLKTTKGKTGKDTATVNLGANAAGTAFWYQDPSVLGTGKYFSYSSPFDAKKPVVINTGFTDYFEFKTIKGTTVPSITAKGLQNSTIVDTLRALQTTFGYKSAGVYCLTFKVTAEDCYRVAGTVKIDVDLFTTNCCAVSGATVVLTNYFDGVEGGISSDFVNRFGSLNYEKATKVEIYSDDVYDIPTTDDNRWFNWGALAGQGTYSTKDKRVDSISGNIVGVVSPPKCPNCCTIPLDAIAFWCDDSTPRTYLATAAFGTFRLKYNKNLK